MFLLLQGKLALVTGAGGSLGNKICYALAKEGATLIITDRNVDTAKEILNSLPGKQHISATFEEANINSIFNKIRLNFTQPPSILVNCIDIIEENIAQGTTVERFQEILKTYLVNILAVMRAVSDGLIKRKMPGSIINIISMTGRTSAMGCIFYTMIKTAVDTLTESVAKEIAEYDIQCVVISYETTKSSSTQPLGSQSFDFYRYLP